LPGRLEETQTPPMITSTRIGGLWSSSSTSSVWRFPTPPGPHSLPAALRTRTSPVPGAGHDVRAMRNITSVDPPNLFTPDLLKTDEPAVSADSSSGVLAREFVQWCWSVGDGFHNSPDLTNLQYWLIKSK